MRRPHVNVATVLVDPAVLRDLELDLAALDLWVWPIATTPDCPDGPRMAFQIRRRLVEARRGAWDDAADWSAVWISFGDSWYHGADPLPWAAHAALWDKLPSTPTTPATGSGSAGSRSRWCAVVPRSELSADTRRGPLHGTPLYPGHVLTIDRATYDGIVAHAKRDHPDEACGIVAGPEGSDRPERLVEMVNAAGSPDVLRVRLHRAARALQGHGRATRSRSSSTTPTPPPRPTRAAPTSAWP